MNKIAVLLLISFIFLGFGNDCAAVLVSGENTVQEEESSKGILVRQEPDSEKMLTENLVQQKIFYYAPNSGEVFLVWRTEKKPEEESVFWNSNTILTDSLLYTPLEMRGDTFFIQLNVPKGSTLYYNFWITKNRAGHYQDYWDLQSSGIKAVDTLNPVVKNAVYSKGEISKSPRTIDFGWKIFVMLSIFFIALHLVLKKNGINISGKSYTEKVLVLGLSLLFFHAIARAEIIQVNLLKIYLHPGLIFNITKAGFDDFIFVAWFVTLFALLLSFLKNVRLKKAVYRIFIGLAICFTLAAFVNISTVIYFGKPFTYQWLYYADFLGSNDAKVALQSNLTFLVIINLVAFCLSMLVFSAILFYVFRLLTTRKIIGYVSFSSIGILTVVLVFMADKTKKNWTEGQAENAVLSMARSIIAANYSSSFFFSENKEETNKFNPAESATLEKPFVDVNQGEVKNVLFIILESAGAAYFDAYGGTYNLSPNLNKYAAQALKFEQAYAIAPATNRSLVSILGSMYPHISYQSLTQEAPDVEQPGLSSVLKKEGYRTSFFSSANLNFQNCKQFLSYRNFDNVEDFATIKCSDKFVLESNNFIEGDGIDDMCLAERFTTWIDEDTTKNFFSILWTVQGHYPYFFGKKEENFGVSNYIFNRYLNCLKYNDELIGRVMNTLEERGIAKKTLVVVVGDHGEAFGQHRQYGHGTAIYEENLKVPLYFINPVLFHGETKEDIALIKDLATTTLSVLGIKKPETWQGRDLINTLSDEAFFFAPWSDYLFGYRKNKMKYIFNETRGTVEVYNLKTDPGEHEDISASAGKEDIDFARKRISAWVLYQNRFVDKIRN